MLFLHSYVDYFPKYILYEGLYLLYFLLFTLVMSFLF